LLTEERVTLPVELLHITLTYENAEFSINSAQIYQGYEPQQSEFAKDYFVVAKDKEGKELERKAFTVNVRVQSLPPLAGVNEDSESEKILDSVGVSIVLPWSDTYQTIEIQSKEEEVLASMDKEEFRQSHNAVSFFTRNRLQSRTSFNEIEPLIDPAEALDITFIGDKYTQSELTRFHQDVTSFSNLLLTFSPFTQYTSKINFHYVDNTLDLGCTYFGRTIVCNPLAVYGAVQLAGVPYDRVVVIVNSSEYGGAAVGELAAVYNGEFGALGFVHEFGHSFSNLADEYLANVGSESTETNCYNGVPPNPAWQGILNVTYHLECNFPNYYRSSPDSIMRTLTALYFNDVSQFYLKNSLDFYTGGLTQTPTPSITQTSSPKLGDANNDQKVDGVDFTIWLSHYNQNTTNGKADGDFNTSGKVDGVDFSIWLSNYNR
jgi:hypothetical protein